MIVEPGCPCPSSEVATTACRSIAWSNACRSSGLSSSLWLACCCGLELMMKSSKATPGLERTWKWAALSVATEVGGTGTSTPSS